MDFSEENFRWSQRSQKIVLSDPAFFSDDDYFIRNIRYKPVLFSLNSENKNMYEIEKKLEKNLISKYSK